MCSMARGRGQAPALDRISNFISLTAIRHKLDFCSKNFILNVKKG